MEYMAFSTGLPAEGEYILANKKEVAAFSFQCCATVIKIAGPT